jgi:hypothetical protein
MIGQTIPAQEQHHTVLRLIARRRHVNCPLDGSAEQAEARYAHGGTSCLTAVRLAASWPVANVASS